MEGGLKARRGTNPHLSAFVAEFRRQHMGWTPRACEVWDAALEAAIQALGATDPAQEIRRLQSHSHHLGVRFDRMRAHKARKAP